MEDKSDNKMAIRQLTASNEKRMAILKWTRTFAMISSWVTMGLYSEVSGPTLPYLKQRVDSNYEEISRVMVARAVGFLVGALVGGILCDRFKDYCDLWFALAQMLAAVGVALAPFCHSLPTLAIMFFMDGSGKGIIAAGSSSVILRLWKEKAAPPTHALHLGFGIGALIVPQIARPFLPHENKVEQDVLSVKDLTSANSTTQYVESVVSGNATNGNYTSTQNNSVQEANPPIEIPFGIVAVLTALVGIWFLVSFFFRIPSSKVPEEVEIEPNGVKTTKKRNSKKSLFGQCTAGESNKTMWMIFVLFLCLFWIFPTGAERAYGRFIYAYATEGPHELSVADGTVAETLFWATFTGTRFAMVFLSIWVPASIIISGSLVLSIAVSIILAFVSQNHVILFWVFNCGFGIALAPVLPASFAWADRYIIMTAMMTSLAFISSAAGAFIFSWISGSLYESAGPQSLMHLMVVYSIVCTAIFAVLFFLGRQKGPRRYCDTKMNSGDKEEGRELEVLNQHPETKESENE